MVQSLKVVVGGLLASCGATYALRPTPQSATVSVVDVHSASSESTARERFLRDGAIVLRGGSTEKMISHMEPLLRQNPRFDGRITLKAGFRESSRGRFHLSFLGTMLQDDAVVLQKSSPWRFLLGPEQSVSLIHLLDSKAKSADQIWHADNTAGGHTIVVAMRDIEDDMGPTCLQLESHKLIQYSDYFWAYFNPTRIARPLLKKGDVLVYSSKVLHRGEANLSQKDRPVIVYRYDDPATPAPGTNFIGTQALAWYGWARA